MKSFEYIRTNDQSSAIAAALQPGSKFLAGGTTQLDLMKCGVELPDRLVDLTRIPSLDSIIVSDGLIRIGALAKMSRVAEDTAIVSSAPAISEALWRAASAQLRNMASIGGNLLQRTRCTYFRDPSAYSACNKRVPGSGCAAIQGNHRNHAILGASDSCIATYPGDMAVALVAFDARVEISGVDARTVLLDDFYTLPGSTPHIETQLKPGELIVGLEIPVTAVLKRSHYLKVRDRASYEFAAASAAVGLELEPDGKTVRSVRIALGGVATKPWRAHAVERALIGKTLSEAGIRLAAEYATDGAHAHDHNKHKMTLAPKVVARALMTVGDLG